MDPRLVTIALAAGRVAIGTAAFVSPHLVGRPWLGSVADEPGTGVVIRMFAIRDLALGLGTLAAIDDPGRTRNWVEAGIIADAGDATAVVLGRGAGRPAARLAVTAVATGAAAAGLWLRDQHAANG